MRRFAAGILAVTCTLSIAAPAGASVLDDIHDNLSETCPEFGFLKEAVLISVQVAESIAQGVLDSLPADTSPIPVGFDIAKIAAGTVVAAAKLTTHFLEQEQSEADGCRTERAEWAAKQKMVNDIVHSLRSSGPPKPLYVLPKSRSGLLDGDPIGVKQVVTDYVAVFQDLGMDTSRAETYLVKGNQLLSSGKYKDAFKNYRQSYAYLVR